MQSLSDLNNFSNDSKIDVTDDRDAQLIYTGPAGDAEFTTTEGNVIFFKDALGVEIEDIVDYANLNMEVEIEMQAPFPDNPEFVYTDKPSYITVTETATGGIISGFRSITDWQWLKNKFGIQNATNWFGEFTYTVTISNDVSAPDVTFDATITVLDIGLLESIADYQYTFQAFPSLQDFGDFIVFDDPGTAPADAYTITVDFDDDYKFNIENVISTSSAAGGLIFDNTTKTVTIQGDREDCKDILENLQIQIANQFEILYEVFASNNDTSESDFESGVILFPTADITLLADPTTQSHDGTTCNNTGLPQITDTTVTTADYTYQINTQGNVNEVYYNNLSSAMTWTIGSIIDLNPGQSIPDYERYFDMDVSSDGETIVLSSYNTGTDSTIEYEREIEIYELVTGTWTKVFSQNPVVGDLYGSGYARCSRNGLVAIHQLSDDSFDYFFKTNGTWNYEGNYSTGAALIGANHDINEDGTKILWLDKLFEYSGGSWSLHSTIPRTTSNGITQGSLTRLSNDGNRVLREESSGNFSEWSLLEWNGNNWIEIATDTILYANIGITWNTTMNDVGDTVVTKKGETGFSIYLEDDNWTEDVIVAGPTTGTSYAGVSLYVNNAGDQIIYGDAPNSTYSMMLYQESTDSWVAGAKPPLFNYSTGTGDFNGEAGLFNNLIQSNRASRDGQRFYILQQEYPGITTTIREVKTPIKSITNVDGVHTIVAPKATINSLISDVDMDIDSAVATEDFTIDVLVETPSAGKTGKSQDVERT